VAEPKIAARTGAKKLEAKADDEEHATGASDKTAAAAVAEAESAFGENRLAAARVLATQAVDAARHQASSELKVRAFDIMGKLELASEEFAQAQRTFERALAIDPKDPVARRGTELAKQGAAKANRP
jgi:tetratricopeptide (TPR) repeat protein